jgi:hypothetical protein
MQPGQQPIHSISLDPTTGQNNGRGHGGTRGRGAHAAQAAAAESISTSVNVNSRHSMTTRAPGDRRPSQAVQQGEMLHFVNTMSTILTLFCVAINDRQDGK